MENNAFNNQLRTKEEIVYEQLKDLLLNGEIPTNHFLPQRALASKVGAAVITVRAALRQLENDGLIENVPRWGVRVPQETAESLKDRYFLRNVFEVEAVRQILKRRHEIDYQYLLELAKKVDEIDNDPNGDLKEYGVFHYKFHKDLVSLVGSPLMSQMYEKINLKYLFFWNAYRIWQSPLTRYLAMHEQLILNIFESSEEDAISDTIRHINQGLESELLIIRNQETLS
jgi:DNA-binding GntR family transcriptional regulator